VLEKKTEKKKTRIGSPKSRFGPSLEIAEISPRRVRRSDIERGEEAVREELKNVAKVLRAAGNRSPTRLISLKALLALRRSPLYFYSIDM